MLKGVILDKRSFDRDDIDLSPLNIGVEVDWTTWDSTSNHEVANRLTGHDIAITNKVVLDRESLMQSGQIKLILIAATGTDNVDLDFCREKGIIACNVRHYSTPSVTQHTISLMLNLMTRQLQYSADVTSGIWSKSEVFCLLDYPIIEAAGKNLGIVGYGTLGKKVAEIARALEMNVNISQRPGGEAEPGRMAFEDILESSDVISLHCPLTPDTYNLFSEKEFAGMKTSAFIINTARGAIIDSAALVEALENGQIAGAGIDVLDQEPPATDHPLLRKGIPNLILTPHNAWGTRESRQRMVDAIGKNLRSWASGSPINVVT